MTSGDAFAKMISEQPGSATSLEPGLPINGEGLPQLGPPSPSPGASGPDNEPGLDDSQIMAEFLKTDGSLVWLQKDNRATYERKGFVLTGNEFNIDEYNHQVRELDKWRAIGNNPGANRAIFPPPVTPPPAPLTVAMPSMLPAVAEKPSVAEPSPKPPLPPAHVNPSSIEV